MDRAKRIEWEAFDEPRTIRPPLVIGDLPAETEFVEVSRDEGYQLRVSFGGESLPTADDSGTVEPQAGSLLRGCDVSGVDEQHGQVLLRGVLLGRFTRNTDVLARRARILGSATVMEAQVAFEADAKEDSVFEWFLNGPRDSVRFPRVTNRRVHEAYRRFRDGDDGHGPASFELAPAPLSSESGSFDHFQVDSLGRRFIVAMVPPEYGPEWSNSLCIEYRRAWGIPDEAEREGIAEIVSFVLGRQLMYVGSSWFGKEGALLRATARSPWGSGVRELCAQSSLPPVRIDYQGTPVEALANALVGGYLARREELGLSSAIWNYWLGRRAPVGSSLVYLASALEGLANRWFKSKESKTKGTYMPKKDYAELFSDELESMERKLNGRPYKEQIVNRLRHASDMGSNDRMRVFLRELGVTAGVAEQQAMKARNRPAHGSAVTGSDGMQHLCDFHGYEVLFHRVLVKLLGYDGPYVDYASLGHPSRELSEPAGKVS